MKCGETYTPEYTYVNNAYLVEEHYGRHLRLLDILLEREVCQELCDMWLLQQSELFVNGWGRTRGGGEEWLTCAGGKAFLCTEPNQPVLQHDT